MSLMSIFLLGALASAAIPVVVALVLAATLIKNEDRSESAWAFIPLSVAIVLFASVGGLSALMCGLWWMGPVVVIVLGALVYRVSTRR